jgi:deoxyribonuclease-4
LRDALRFGLHTSTAGALENAAIEAAEAGATAFQIFSSSPRMWRGSIPGQAEIKALQDRRKKHDLAPLAIHGNYLINLASADAEIRRKSIQAFRAEIARALLIGADYLVFHPGSFKDWTPEQALVAAGNGMAEAAHGLSGPLMLLIENTAGQGSSLGSKLEELAELRRLTGARTEFEIGYCIDTCHSFAAGYDLSSRPFIDTVEATLGWKRVPILHANDSKGARGSRIDRHEHIGRGQIGECGFRFLLRQRELRGKTFILETPAEDPSDDRRNLAMLRSLASSGARREE